MFIHISSLHQHRKCLAGWTNRHAARLLGSPSQPATPLHVATSPPGTAGGREWRVMLGLAKDEEDDGHVDIFTNISHLPWKQRWYKSHISPPPPPPPLAKTSHFPCFLVKNKGKHDIFTASRTTIG